MISSFCAKAHSVFHWCSYNKLISFLPFSLPSPWLLLKLPTVMIQKCCYHGKVTSYSSLLVVISPLTTLSRTLWQGYKPFKSKESPKTVFPSQHHYFIKGKDYDNKINTTRRRMSSFNKLILSTNAWRLFGKFCIWMLGLKG